MKKRSKARLVNSIAIAVLLLASLGYHVQKAFDAKKDESSSVSKAEYRQSFLSPATFSLLFFKTKLF